MKEEIIKYLKRNIKNLKEIREKPEYKKANEYLNGRIEGYEDMLDNIERGIFDENT